MWTRRQLLRTGALGSAALLAPPVVAAEGPTRLLVIVVDGGWDATFALDPKLGSTAIATPVAPAGVEEVRTYAGIPLQVNDTTRPSVSAFFARHAARCAVVNGLWLGGIAHRPNKARLLTGTRDEGAPDLVTAVGAELGANTAFGAVDLSGFGYAGRMGADQARVVGQLQGLVQTADPADDAVAAYLRARGAGVAGYAEALDRAAELRLRGAELGGILDRGDEKERLPVVLDRALDLLDAGFAVSALLETGLDWDTHTDNDRQGAFHEDLFATLLGAVDRMEASGALDRTLVALVSEVGRTPWINGELGKDHWPSGTALLLGGPVAGGRSLGGTDDRLDPLPVDLQTGQIDPGGQLLRYDHFVAGLVEAVGADPVRLLPSVEPFRGFRV